ncbi:MAG: hypothetical protein WKF34_04430 [Pyrinomonadaceae bacterium]
MIWLPSERSIAPCGKISVWRTIRDVLTIDPDRFTLRAEIRTRRYEDVGTVGDPLQTIRALGI